MKQAPSEKYSVAWFKLSECIAKGERERALGLYRLLAHSLDNKALAKQLEADILMLFKDTLAHDKYQEAALLFASQKKWHEAAALYEHLVTLGRDTIELYARLISWYDKIDRTDKVSVYRAKLVHKLCALTSFERTQALNQIGVDMLDCHQIVALYTSLVGYYYSQGADAHQLETIISQSVSYLLTHGAPQQLQQYLSHLESLDTGLYHQAQEIIKR